MARLRLKRYQIGNIINSNNMGTIKRKQKFDSMLESFLQVNKPYLNREQWIKTKYLIFRLLHFYL